MLGLLLIAESLRASASSDNKEFARSFGDMILERIRAEKAMKVSVEEKSKISLEQDADCNSDGVTMGTPLPSSRFQTVITTRPSITFTTATTTTFKPTPDAPFLVDVGASSFVVPCTTNGDIVQGPQFIIPTPTSNYYLNVTVFSPSSPGAVDTTRYLSYNPFTGYLSMASLGPTFDITQVYSAVLLNKLTNAMSSPVLLR
ncbi:hypothetical protein BV898_09278 [Hypsibius exemplaris]|uniref:Uncharacterized protein n=1 Tax=Hypsibius exemplaris TaxID=2072580 RepID=A0A1W0WN35_HYPEX|nr:hypothetical protein BV898_09278 [Hypsibius exemplaris]